MKKIFAIILALVTLMSLCACKKAEDFSKLTLNAEGFGQNLVNACSFGITPEAVESNEAAIAASLDAFRIDAADLNTVDGKPEFFYATTGNQSADFVMVLGAKDTDTAKKLSEGAIKNWIDSLKKDSGYNPEEAPKLENCINKVAGRYVIVICAKDSAAAEAKLSELLTNALKQNV